MNVVLKLICFKQFSQNQITVPASSLNRPGLSFILNLRRRNVHNLSKYWFKLFLSYKKKGRSRYIYYTHILPNFKKFCLVIKKTLSSKQTLATIGRKTFRQYDASIKSSQKGKQQFKICLNTSNISS